MDPERVARGLGWFSIGLGAAELLAPGMIARVAGSRNHKSLMRMYGLRELAAGVGILATSRPAPWLWARVAGDMLDLASLGSVAADARNGPGKALFSIASVAGVTVLDVCTAAKLSESTGISRAEANMIIGLPPEECYRFWRNFENLPRFMTYLETVRSTGGSASHWVARGPGGARIEWDAEIVDDVPNQRIAWRSREGSEVYHAGSVEFQEASGGRGTIVRVQMDYGHPLRALEPVATLLGKDPEQMIRKELRRFKQVIETGEAITTEGQPAGRTSGATWLDRVAR